MAAKDADKATTPAFKKESVFEKAEILKSAGLFGVTPEIMAGALSLVRKGRVTKTEVASAVKAFLVRPVGKE